MKVLSAIRNLLITTLSIIAIERFCMQAVAESINVSVPEMECESCSNAIQGRLKKEAGVSKVTPDLDARVVKIETDDTVKFTDEQIKKLIKESGFDATDVTRN